MIYLLSIPIRDATRADSCILPIYRKWDNMRKVEKKGEADPGSSPGRGYPQWGNVPTLEVSDSRLCKL